MAKRNSRRSRAIQPAERKLIVEVPGDGTSYIDIALAMSVVNRRLYKQGMNYAVGSIKVFNFGVGEGAVGLYKLPSTWVAKNAYVKSKALWDQMNNQVLDDEPSIAPRYHDFKIAADSTMSAASIQNTTGAVAGNILLPQDGAGNIAEPGEWIYSTVEIPDPDTGVSTEFKLHMLGDNSLTSKGLIRGYAKSRARVQPTDPNVPLGGDWMNDLFDDGGQLEDLRENLEEDNDQPPYKVGAVDAGGEFYPGSKNNMPGPVWHGFAPFTQTTVSQQNRVDGGMFPCGLLIVSNNVANEVFVEFELVPGNYKGVMAEEMY